MQLGQVTHTNGSCRRQRHHYVFCLEKWLPG